MTDTPPSVPRSTEPRPATPPSEPPMATTPPTEPPTATTPPTAPPPAAAPAGPHPTTTPPTTARPTARTRISTAWVGVVATALVIALLLLFILQNTQSVKVSYFTADGHLPLGVALLLAAIGGVLLTAGVASLRILQLRRRANPGGRLSGRGRAGRHQMGT